MAAKKNSRATSEYHGILLVDKPSGVTSHDVVDRVRHIFQTRRVGHTGTLDPQATGLLVVLVGEATKISEYLMGVDKSYEGTIRFGHVSDTYDLDGEIKPGPGGPIPTDIEAVQDTAAELTGEISQTPPPYSAKKVAGKKLYEYARAGKVPDVEPRQIRVDDFEIITLNGELCEFGVDCSSGTYVRSLVNELGQRLGCGALLAELRRTDVGPFGIEDARTIEELARLETPDDREAAVIPIRRALPQFPTLYMTPNADPWIQRGQAIPHNMVHSEDDLRPPRGQLVVLCRIDGQAVAIARVDPAPLSPPPRSMYGATPPWYQPIKQFVIPTLRQPVDEEESEV